MVLRNNSPQNMDSVCSEPKKAFSKEVVIFYRAKKST
jgi:hypothetical protein